jgi:hypothetical protein
LSVVRSASVQERSEGGLPLDAQSANIESGSDLSVHTRSETIETEIYTEL